MNYTTTHQRKLFFSSERHFGNQNNIANFGRTFELGARGILLVKIGFDTAENGPFEVRDRKAGVQVPKRIPSGDDQNFLQRRFNHWTAAHDDPLLPAPNMELSGAPELSSLNETTVEVSTLIQMLRP